MVSTAVIKQVKSLQQRKYRRKYGQYVVEGVKLVGELMAHAPADILTVYATDAWLTAHPEASAMLGTRLVSVSDKSLGRMSGLRTPNQVLAVATIRESNILPERLQQGLSLYLDGIQDPGNFGTILRTADWFGLPYVFASPDSANLHTPKVIQATMGAFLRVPVVSIELPDLLGQAPGHYPVYGALLDGEDVRTHSKRHPALLVIGNESQGIRPEVLPYITHPVRIPGRGGAESLNAAVATGILCSVLG